MFRLKILKAQRVLGQIARGCFTDLVEEDWPVLQGRPYWSPRNNPEDLYMLVEAANNQGLITGGPGEELTYMDGGDDSDGPYFYWAVNLAIPGRITSLRIADYADETRHLTPPETYGADAALWVLRRGVEAGNRLLSRLDAYVAARNGGNDAGTDRSDNGST